MVALYTVGSGQKSDQQDCDQLVKTFNGTQSSPILVSNKIQSSMFGAISACAYIGGVFTKGDTSRNNPSQPSSASKPKPPTSGTYAQGDVAIDQAGLLWIATANTSGTTPWLGIGRGGDSTRTRAHLASGSHGGGSPMGPTQNFTGWDWGGVQYDGGTSGGFLIPTSGYYLLTCTVKGTGLGSSSYFTVNWIQGSTIFCNGDRVKSDGSSTADAGSVVEDIKYLTAGTYIAPYVTLSGSATLGTAANDPAPDSKTVYAIVQLLSASLSS